MSDLPFILKFDISRAEVLTGRLAHALADAEFLPFWAAWWGAFGVHFGIVALFYGLIWRFGTGALAGLIVQVFAGFGLLDVAVRIARLVWLWGVTR